VGSHGGSKPLANAVGRKRAAALSGRVGGRLPEAKREDPPTPYLQFGE